MPIFGGSKGAALGGLLAIIVILVIIIIAVYEFWKHKTATAASQPPLIGSGAGPTPTPASTANQQAAATQFAPATWVKLEKIAPASKTSFTDDDGLNVAEIQVITDHKLAPGDFATITASSIYASNNPQVVVDGNTDGFYPDGSVYLTAGEKNPWLLLKLATPAVVTEVVIWNRTDCCQTRMAGAILSLMDATGLVIASAQIPANFSGVVFSANFANKTVTTADTAP